MNNRVAIWANRAEVIDWVNFVFFANFRELPQVMNVDKAFTHFTIHFLKIKIANTTTCSIVGNTQLTRFGVPFVGIN